MELWVEFPGHMRSTRLISKKRGKSIEILSLSQKLFKRLRLTIEK